MAIAATLHAGIVTYTYDPVGRPLLVDYGTGTAVRYSYDNSGNLLAKSVLAARLELRPTAPLIFVGQAGTLNLTITFAQGKDTAIALSSSNTAVAGVPASVTLPAGATSLTVSVQARSTGSATVTARLPVEIGGASASAELLITTPPAPQTSYALADRGGLSLTTLGTSATPTIGYARIQPNPGSTTPAGLAIFGLRQNGILVTEAGVPASPLLRSGRIFAETSGPTNTGLALANPNAQPANISFFFTDLEGVNVATGNTVLAANSQMAAFLNERPFNGSSSFVGTFTFISDVRLFAIALRGFGNERSEFLLTTLPVADLSAAGSSETAMLPHFVEGGGWTTQAVLVNPSDQILSGTLEFWSQGTSSAAAERLSLKINSITGDRFTYSIPPRSARRFQGAGESATPITGSVRILPQANHRTPSAVGIFSLKKDGVRVTEAGVPGTSLGKALRMYAEVAPQSGSIQTGVAVSTVSQTATIVNFELTTLAGISTGLAASVTIPANGQVAIFVSDLPGFGAVSLPFQGVLRITTGSAVGISVVGLRTRVNERGDFLITTTPPVDENAAPSSEEAGLPHFADGGGFTMQIILFSRSPGQRPQGIVKFFDQSGRPLNLTFK